MFSKGEMDLGGKILAVESKIETSDPAKANVAADSSSSSS